MRHLTGLLSIFLLFASCEKNDSDGTDDNNGSNGNNTQQLVFYSLTTDKDTIIFGETATITAVASGYNLSYSWSATGGSILGSGNEVTYAAGSCQAGTNTIACKVTDAYNNSESKEVSIFVH
jgi:hypothetical protein